MLAVLRQAGWHQKTPNPEENTFEYTKKKSYSFKFPSWLIDQLKNMTELLYGTIH
jgi:hypothetical protein